MGRVVAVPLLNSDQVTYLALFASWALVASTIVLMWWQTRQAQELHSANAVIGLRERFDSVEFRAARRRTAHFLLHDTTTSLPDLQVAAFFELMGSMVEHRVLDRELVWRVFGGWITNYFYALRNPRDRLGAARQEMRDPLLFGDFEWLAKEVDRLDRRQMGTAYDDLIPPDQEARAILTRESKLALFKLTDVEAVPPD